MRHDNAANDIASTPTQKPLEFTLSTPNHSLRVLGDTTDTEGIRRIELQTTATGNTREGYKAAEREAHSWFFANYDPINPFADTDERTEDAAFTTELGLTTGRITEEWLASSHPVMKTRTGTFMFGHHTGLNPSSPNDGWRFQFEIVPLRLK